MILEKENFTVTLKLSLQRALLGEISANLFAVTAGIKDNLIRVDAYFYEVPGEEDIESIRVATTEVIADFPEGFMIEEFWFSITEHKPAILDFWSFMRKS